MIVFGKNVFNEISEIKKIRKVFLSKNFNDQAIIKYIKENKISYEFVDNFRLDKLANGNHQGIVIEINDYEYFELSTCFQDDMIVILDHLEDVHNFGAIIRTCEAAGIKSIIIPKDRSVRVNEIAMKTSSGAINYVNIIMVNNIVNAIKELQKENFYFYTADMDGANYREINYASKKALIIGSEGNGVSRLVKENSDEIISIPMSGHVNSLNASVAAAILIYGMRD